MSEGERRLAAIMFTDMVGFTALTQSDEALSLTVLERHNRLLRPFFSKFHGREIKTIGDSFLVEFDSALDATTCAVEVQSFLHDYNISTREEWKVTLRIGIHLGDVVHRDGDVFGDAVNIASRLHPLAEPEGVCISDQVYGQVRNKIQYPLVRLEPRDLKGVKFSVDVYKVLMPWQNPAASLAASAGAPSTSLDRMRVAVLPLTNLSSNPEEGYFADGMTEEIITSLSRVKELTVIARTSIMGYKGTTKKAKEIGTELGVGSILEGSVRKAGNRVRITAQLIAASTEGHLWAENYDRTLEDVFAVQSEIAEKVAGELKVQLLDSEKKTLEKKPTVNMEAYNDFLRGRELYREGSEPSLRQALKLYERAVELDRSFARAYVGMSECHQFLGTVGYEPRDTMISAVKAALKRALELDPGLAEAHASLAVLHLNEDDLVETESEARRALELNPSLPEPYRQLSEIEAIRGQPQEMLRLIEMAYRLDPVLPNYVFLLGQTYYWTGREQELAEHWKKTEQLAPSATYAIMSEYYLSKGEMGKAREFYEKYEKLRPDSPRAIWMRGCIDAAGGDKAKGLQAIKKIEERNMGPITYNYVAFVCHALGDMDGYFENMNRALEEHVILSSVVMYSPLLAKGREDPRYEELVEKLRRQTGLEK